MRRRNIVVISAALAFAALALLLVVRHPRSSPAPVVAFTLVGYTEKTNSVWATVRLTNKGRETVVYEAWGGIPYGWMKAETKSGWTNDDLAPRLTGGAVVLRPGSNEVFAVPLPLGTLRWKCGFSVRTANFRERVAGGITASAMPSQLYPLCGWVLELFPYRRGAEAEFQSEIFETEGPARNERSGVDAGRAPRFAFLSQWPGATHRGC